MIKVEKVTKSYKVQGKRKTVFADVSLQINPGERFALLGPNGAGKSTMLRLLCGIEKPNSGEIIRTSTISWPIGVNSGFLPNLTGRENIKFVSRLFDVARDDVTEKIEFVQGFAELGDYFDMPISTYSSGMKSRLGFGMSMAFDFDFYVSDETFSVGDKKFKEKSRALFEERALSKGLLMVSHSLGIVKQFCTKGVFIHKGQVTYSEDIEEIIALYKQYA